MEKINSVYLLVILALLFSNCSDEDEPDPRLLITIDGINYWTHMRVSTPARLGGPNRDVPGYWGLDVSQIRDNNRLIYDAYYIGIKTEILENEKYPVTLSATENNFYIHKIEGRDDPGGGNPFWFTDHTTTLTIESIKDGKIWASFSGKDEDGFYGDGSKTTEGKIEGVPLSDFSVGY